MIIGKNSFSLFSARERAKTNIWEEQRQTKEQYNKKCIKKKYEIKDWALRRFLHEESGKKRKLSKPLHGFYRDIQKSDPDMTVVPVHFPESGSIIKCILNGLLALLVWWEQTQFWRNTYVVAIAHVSCTYPTCRGNCGDWASWQLCLY